MTEGPLDHLIRMLAGLPGLGNRSARRIALHLLERRDTLMMPLARGLERVATEIRDCSICGNLDSASPCRICCDSHRDAAKICVVAHVSDVWAVERTGAYKGRYHVLGGLLSALDGIGPGDLRIDALLGRLKDSPQVAANDAHMAGKAPDVEEVILALSATVDGQSTAHYISDRLQHFSLKVTRLAHGVPVGGELDYLDDGTIVTALNSRSAA